MKNHFPDCEIFTMPQHLEDGTANPDWLAIRKGVLTASTLGAWILDTKGGVVATNARESAICKLIAETTGAWEPRQFETDAMKRGTELEPEAVSSFERATGKKVKQVGFCRSIHGLFGCSPDGLIYGDNGGFEGKVPIPSTHIKYRRAGELPDEYRMQVEMSMAVTGASHWWFQAYNPGLVPLRIIIKRSSYTESLKAALIEFSGQLEVALTEEFDAWTAAKAKGEI
jgi:predicted phage-related endonuclease